MKKVLWMAALATLLAACDKKPADNMAAPSTTSTNSATSTNK